MLPVPSVDEYVDQVVSTAPALTAEQRARLADLLAGRRPGVAEPHRELAFREHQASWRRRIAASRRLPELKDDTTDSEAPGGRWAS